MTFFKIHILMSTLKSDSEGGTWDFPGCHPKKNPAFFQTQKKSGFAEPEIFLGFEISDLRNQGAD